MARQTRKSIKLDPARRRWLESEVAAGRFRDLDTAVDHCVRQAARIERERDRIERLLLEGIESRPAETVDSRWWDAMRADARARVGTPRRKSA